MKKIFSKKIILLFIPIVILFFSVNLGNSQQEKAQQKKIPKHQTDLKIVESEILPPQYCSPIWKIRLTNTTSETINNVSFVVQELIGTQWRKVIVRGPEPVQSGARTYEIPFPYKNKLKDRVLRAIIKRGNQIACQTAKEIIPGVRAKITVFHTAAPGKLYYTIHVENTGTVPICDHRVQVWKYMGGWRRLGEPKDTGRLIPGTREELTRDWDPQGATKLRVTAQAKASENSSSWIQLDSLTQDLSQVRIINLYENLQVGAKAPPPYYRVEFANNNVLDIYNVKLSVKIFSHAYFAGWMIPHIGRGSKYTQQLGGFNPTNPGTIKIRVILEKDNSVVLDREVIVK